MSLEQSSEMPALEKYFYSHLYRIKRGPNNLISMKMLLQRSHCDSAPVSVARTAAVRVSDLSGDCYVSGKRVTGDRAGPLQPASRPGAERGKEGGMKWE